MGEMVEFPSNGSTGGGYLAPAHEGAGLGVVVIQEWWGLVDHIVDVCDRFAGRGLHRAGAGPVPRQDGAQQGARRGGQGAHGPRPGAGRPRPLRCGRLPPGPRRRPGPRGGGGRLLHGRRAGPAGWRRCGPTRCGPPSRSTDRPGRRRARLVGNDRRGRGPLRRARRHGVARGGGRLRGPAHRSGQGRAIFSYPGTGHAFFNDTRPEVYDEDAARQAWVRTLEFLRAKMG